MSRQVKQLNNEAQRETRIKRAAQYLAARQRRTQVRHVIPGLAEAILALAKTVHGDRQEAKKYEHC